MGQTLISLTNFTNVTVESIKIWQIRANFLPIGGEVPLVGLVEGLALGSRVGTPIEAETRINARNFGALVLACIEADFWK